MSLLMQALKKAEQAKKQTAKAAGDAFNQQPEALEISAYPALDAMVPVTEVPAVTAEVASPETQPAEAPLSLTMQDLPDLANLPNLPDLPELQPEPVRREPQLNSPVAAMRLQELLPKITADSPAPLTAPAITVVAPVVELPIAAPVPEVAVHNPAPVELSLSPSDAPIKPPTAATSAPAAPAPTTASKPNKAPQSPSRRLAIIAGSGVILLMLCASGFFYYWQSMQYPDLALQTQRQLNKPAQLPPVVPAVVASAASAVTAAAPPAAATTTASPADVHAVTNDSDLSARLAPNNTKHAQVRTSASVATTVADAGSAAEVNSYSKQQANSRSQPPSHTPQDAAADSIQIRKGLLSSNINTTLTNAYEQFSSGNVNTAKPLYESVLRTEPNNRDALLGLAAIALKQNQPEQAATLYSRLLDLDPTDPDAIAGLTSLRHGDLEQSESQLKKTLARNPQSGTTLFELGNLYMQQSRYAEAQESYFRAFGNSPANADYAFNLAISLDRLGQIKLAIDYYQRALTLASSGSNNINQNAAQTRIAQLQQAVSR